MPGPSSDASAATIAIGSRWPLRPRTSRFRDTGESFVYHVPRGRLACIVSSVGTIPSVT